jgi:hypothetical protein
VKRFIIYSALVSAVASGASAQSFINWPQAVAWQIDTGLDYSSGKYGAPDDTSVLSVPLEGRVQFDRVRLEFSLPYLEEKGPGVLAGVVVVGSGPVTMRSGIGDLNLGAAFLLNKDGDLPAVELEGIVKAPTAGTGLGTGKVDYSVQANLYHSFTPRFMLFGSLGYQWLSDFSTIRLESGMTATGGVNYHVADAASIGLSAAFRQEYFAGLGNQVTVSPYVLWNLAPDWRVAGYGTFGAGKASPDYGFGFRLVYYRQ